MNEAYVVKKFIVELKRRLPEAVVDKHCDRMSGGIPDVSVDYGGFTTWVEAKFLRDDESTSKRRKHFDELQLVRAERRAKQVDCRYLVAYHVSRTLFIAMIYPQDLRKALAGDDLNLLTYSHLIGPFNQVVERLVKALKERSDVYHSRFNPDEKALDRPGRPAKALPLR